VSSPIAIYVSQTKKSGKSSRKLLQTPPNRLWGEPIALNAAQAGGKPTAITLEGNGATIRSVNGSKYLVVMGKTRSKKSLFTLTLDGFKFNGFGTADTNGGALHIQGVDNLILKNTSFTNCTGAYGGAVYVSGNGTIADSPAVRISHCSFSNNNALHGGGYATSTLYSR